MAAAIAVAGAGVAMVTPAEADGTVTATVDHWSDGDTVVTDLGKIRLIGINAPDVGECGYGKATKSAIKLAPVGSTIVLTAPTGHDDTDQYGRLLRYVAVGAADVGLKQIKAGSVAKFDSTDGYDAHPKQAKYRKTDIKKRDYCGSSDLKSYEPVSDNKCPKNAPIKGNRSEDWIYHLPTNQYYSVTNPEECFASGDGAKKARVPGFARLTSRSVDELDRGGQLLDDRERVGVVGRDERGEVVAAIRVHETVPLDDDVPHRPDPPRWRGSPARTPLRVVTSQPSGNPAATRALKSESHCWADMPSGMAIESMTRNDVRSGVATTSSPGTSAPGLNWSSEVQVPSNSLVTQPAGTSTR